MEKNDNSDDNKKNNLKEGKTDTITNKKKLDESKNNKTNKKERKNKKEQSIPSIDEEMKGFLIFTDKHREKNCTKDAFNILNDVTEKLYPNIYNDHNNINLNEDINQNNNKDNDKIYLQK